MKNLRMFTPSEKIYLRDAYQMSVMYIQANYDRQ